VFYLPWTQTVVALSCKSVVFNTHPSSLQPCCLTVEIAYMTRRSDEVTMYFPASHSVNTYFFYNGHSVNIELQYYFPIMLAPLFPPDFAKHP